MPPGDFMNTVCEPGMRRREIHDAGDEAVGVVVHGLSATRVQHVDPHLLQQPLEPFDRTGATPKSTSLGAIKRRRLREQRAVARPQHLRVREVGRRVVVARRQLGEVLDQSGDQRWRQRGRRAHERGGKESEDLVHAPFSRARATASSDERARRQIVTRSKPIGRRKPGAQVARATEATGQVVWARWPQARRAACPAGIVRPAGRWRRWIRAP